MGLSASRGVPIASVYPEALPGGIHLQGGDNNRPESARKRFRGVVDKTDWDALPPTYLDRHGSSCISLSVFGS